MLRFHPLPSDTDLLALHRQAPSRYPLLLESVASGTAQGRWDLLLATDGSGLQLDPDGTTRDLGGQVQAGDFLAVLDAHWRRDQVAAEEPRWPFHGGWALLLDYELAAQVEPVLQLPRRDGAGRPVALALRCPAAVLRDRASGECMAVVEEAHAALMDLLVADVEGAVRQQPPDPWQPPASIVEDDPQRFLEGVGRILDHLRAGDVFQVNLSRAWRARFEAPLDPAAFYQRLRLANPAPFAGLFAGPGWAVASSSPERLVSVRGRVVETRPIAGTRPRFEGDDDAARIRELVGHPKERAEHVMLIDLERNDLGRVCEPGSVQVDELMTVESYAHVHHIVSNVRGILREDATPGQVIAAVYPGGTITGCPKVRCMQIIAALEATPRGAYTGAIGWLDRNGDLDLNILIRSAELQGHEAVFRTGAGIVADSVPERELEETRAKARGLLRALEP
ncbi:aminodeoxychorismate synthase component I [Pseudoxanthomonas sp. 10H]|uniref:aminodeoxychorismate synthase component I n=1 Tax=Pseudoxanthomonas sp. 10H TaxID=3242729 RepID=UPI0035577140